MRQEIDHMRIRIIRNGVFRQGGQPLAIGTELDVADDFSSWPGKWEAVTEPAPRKLEVATPDHAAGNIPLDKVDEHAAADDLSELRAEYERVIGSAPHGRMKPETMRERIADSLAQSEGESE